MVNAWCDYAMGRYRLQLGRQLLRDGVPVRIGSKALDILSTLVEAAGDLVTKEELLDRVWRGRVVEEHAIHVHVSALRKALGNEAKWIVTVSSRGYRFVGPGERGTFPPPDIKKSPRLSVMVDLLRNLSASEEHDRLVQSVTEDVATDLSRLPGFFVVYHAEAVHSGGDSGSSRDLARGFGVGYVIQWSLRGTEGKIGVNVRLIDVETGGHLWADRFDINVGDTVDAGNEVAGRMVRALSLKLIEDVNRRIEALPQDQWTPDDLVLRGRALNARPLSAANRRDAIRCFEQALDKDPDSVHARIGIASVLIANVGDGWSCSVERDEMRAERLLRDALRDGTDVHFVHTLMGILRRLQGRLDDSEVELMMAVRLAPNYPLAIGQLGLTLVCRGRPKAAIPQIERSLRLAPNDPLTPIYDYVLGLCHLLLNHVETAIICLRKARAGNPRLYYIHLWLAAALGLAGELGEAGAALRDAIEINPEIASPWGLHSLLRQGSRQFVTLFERTIYPGLRRAGFCQ